MERYGVQMIKQLKPVFNPSESYKVNLFSIPTFLFSKVLSDLGTFLHKAIPDTRMTIGRYADAKFEYLSYCLKVGVSFACSAEAQLTSFFLG